MASKRFWRHCTIIRASLQPCLCVSSPKYRRQHSCLSARGNHLATGGKSFGHRQASGCPHAKSKLHACRIASWLAPKRVSAAGGLRRPAILASRLLDGVAVDAVARRNLIASAINQIEPLNTRNYTERLISVCFRAFRG